MLIGTRFGKRSKLKWKNSYLELTTDADADPTKPPDLLFAKII